MNKLTALTAPLLLLLQTSSNCFAEFPDRPLHLIVPYTAGGPNDVIARFIGQKLTETWGQQVLVENRPGAGGNLAVELVARSLPDGYTMVLPAIPFVVNPLLFHKVGYRIEDLAAVSIVAKGPNVLLVNPNLGVNNLQELITLARQKPGKLDYGSSGKGSSLHLAAELFKQQAGIDIQHVPYKGTNELMTDLLAGRVPIAFISPLIAKQHVADGRLRALGITSSKRASSWPELPTIAEGGLPGYTVETWWAVLVPKATPREIVNKLGEGIAMAANAPDVKAKLAATGIEAVGSTPTEAADYIARDAARWEKVMRAANIQPE